MKLLRNSLILLLATLLMLSAFTVFPASAEETLEMTPMYNEPFQPEGVTFGRVSFLIQDTQGLTKDGWDNNIEHNEDLVLISYVKDGVAYEHKTVKEIKAALGDLALKRTCYTYDAEENGMIRLNLVLHMDDHNTLKPADITMVTVKKGFVWCVGSPNGITGELSALTLDRAVFIDADIVVFLMDSGSDSL